MPHRSIWVSKRTTIGSDNGLSPGLRLTIIRTNAGILLIGPSETNLSEIFIEIYTLWFKKMHLNMPSRKWRQFCLSSNVLTAQSLETWRVPRNEGTLDTEGNIALCREKVLRGRTIGYEIHHGDSWIMKYTKLWFTFLITQFCIKHL